MTTRILPWHHAEETDVDALLFELEDQTNCRRADMLRILEDAATALRIILNGDEDELPAAARLAPGWAGFCGAYGSNSKSSQSIAKSSSDVFQVRCYIPLRAGRHAVSPAQVSYCRSGGGIDLQRILLPVSLPAHEIPVDTLDRETYQAIVEAVDSALHDEDQQALADSYFLSPLTNREEV